MHAKRKLWVTGAQGFVAGSVLAQASADWEVNAVSRNRVPTPPDNVLWHACDVLAPKQLARLFRKLKPDVVIHTAALADIDVCQAQPQLARSVNVELTRTLTDLCANIDAKLVFCSTDTVFDGEHAPYREGDSPGPVNRYAETKAEAEQIVSALGPRAVIARLALVVGLPLLGAGNSFLTRLLAAFKEGRVVGVAGHEIRTPVDVLTAGKALLEMASGPHAGIFHLAGLTRVNRLKLNQTIAERFGFSRELTVPQPAGAHAKRAPRPRDVSLTSSRSVELQTSMRTLDEGLSLVLQQRAQAQPVESNIGGGFYQHTENQLRLANQVWLRIWPRGGTSDFSGAATGSPDQRRSLHPVRTRICRILWNEPCAGR